MFTTQRVEECASLDDEAILEDVDHKRRILPVHEQQIFSHSDHEESDDEVFQTNMIRPEIEGTHWRKPSKEEIKNLTVATISQTRSSYNLRNRMVDADQGVPR